MLTAFMEALVILRQNRVENEKDGTEYSHVQDDRNGCSGGMLSTLPNPKNNNNNF